MGRDNWQRGRGNGGRGNRNNGGGRGRGNKKFHHNKSSKAEQLPEMAPPPLTYNVRPDKQTRIKVCWKIGKTEEEEKLPVYDDTNNEDYLRTLIEFCSLLDDYEELKEDGKASVITRMYKKILKSSAKISFIANIKN